MADTIIKDWFLVNFKNEDSVISQVPGGVVVEDIKNRWAPRNFVCTSPVVENLDKGLYRTRNSKYLCQREGQRVTLQAEALIELRAGYSPDEFLARKALGVKGYQVQ